MPETPPQIDTSRPHSARMYDYFIGGKNHFAADRKTAAEVLRKSPSVRIAARENRAFLGRAIRYLTAEAGIRQFLDIGTGLPTTNNVHEVAQAVAPASRVVYVDNDPLVRAQSERLLAGTSGIRVILGDLRDPDRLLADPELRELIDFTRPAGLLMTAVVHFVADESDPWGLVRRYLAALAPGSYLALSHLTSDHKPPRAVREFRQVFDRATEQMHFRSRPEVQRLFDGLDMISAHDPQAPGRLCYVGDWEAEDPAMADSDGSRWLYCGVARRP